MRNSKKVIAVPSEILANQIMRKSHATLGMLQHPLLQRRTTTDQAEFFLLYI